MPLHIVRNDITLMRVDAIVNTTNEWLIPGGTGVDASIHAAAGPELAEELRDILHCETGSAVITGAHRLKTCRHIIHAVSPVYRGGTAGEEELLKKCYRKVFALAEENGCESIAMPVLCSGANGYPRREAYRIAAGAARAYLAGCDDEMKIYLVVFSREMTDVSLDEDDNTTQFITDEYSEYKKAELEFDRLQQLREKYICCDIEPEEELCAPGMASQNVIGSAPKEKSGRKPLWSRKEKTAAIPMIKPQAAAPVEEEEDYRMVDLSFGHMCDWWMDRKNISISEFYNRANITKGTFGNLRNKPGSVPKKKIALACVIGLRLNMDEANDLLGRAGLTFSKYYETDRIVMQCMKKGMYDIDEINWMLMEEMPEGETLGSGTYEKVS